MTKTQWYLVGMLTVVLVISAVVCNAFKIEADTDNCAATVLATGKWVDAALVDTCPSLIRDGAYGRQYDITLSADGDVTIEMQSEDVDTYLYLTQYRRLLFIWQKGWVIVAENDDYDGPNSRIFVENLPAGNYRIDATTWLPVDAGQFQIRVNGNTIQGIATPIPVTPTPMPTETPAPMPVDTPTPTATPILEETPIAEETPESSVSLPPMPQHPRVWKLNEKKPYLVLYDGNRVPPGDYYCSGGFVGIYHTGRPCNTCGVWTWNNPAPVPEGEPGSGRYFDQSCP